MSRIYLKPHKHNNYRIYDSLDDKKLGTIKFKQDKYSYHLNKKYQDKLLETEALLLLNPDIQMTFKQYYCDFIQQYCNEWIDSDFLTHYDFPHFADATRLKQCEDDMFNRKAWLHPVARKAWKKMKKAAELKGIKLQIISAYRSLAYQKQLIENKINKGQSIQDILTVNTLPGFSEHHTGCAIDIGSPNAAVLEAEFDQSTAYDWLIKNAPHFNFYLTYPKDNSTGIMYEPWHWCYKKPDS